MIAKLNTIFNKLMRKLKKDFCGKTKKTQINEEPK
jgi:hypothetical protein